MTAILLLVALAGRAQTNLQRVAMMDFSTDDNSYRSTQLAADLTSVVQTRMADEPGVEWVERAQLDKARQELELSAAELAASGSSVQRGKWVNADWMITGQFSLDDQNRRTLFVEITDLKRADTLASQTVVFPGISAAPFQTDTNQVDVIIQSLHQLFSAARQHQQQAVGKILVSPLFLANVSGMFDDTDPFQHKLAVEQQFNEALQRAAAAHDEVRLIHFPKAYRSTGESEMVLGGLVDTDRDAWQQTADLYVWGTYSRTNTFIPGQRPDRKLKIALHLWDGATAPVTISVALPGNAPDEAINTALEKLAGQVIAAAHKNLIAVDSAATRKEIALSLVKTYDEMTLRFHDREDLGLHSPERFLQAAHLLETACFFDPDNANARVLYITCRWGWWMDFHSNVKNQFWSIWRRSQAWGEYVNRFGLKPVTTQLPFPYNMNGGIPAMYVDSLQGALQNFPNLTPEELAPSGEWRLSEVRSTMSFVESQGFPKDMPPGLALKWRQDTEAELARRKKMVDEYNRTAPAPTNRPPGFATAHPVVPKNLSSAPTNGAPAHPVVKRSSYPHPAPNVNAPDWLKWLGQNRNLFHLSPPDALPLVVKPAFREISFPAQFEVQSVRQLDFFHDRLLILASDERSAPSSDDKPDLSAELLDKRNRVWTLAPGTDNPTLFEPATLPESVASFYVLGDRLWIAGKNTGYLDLSTHTFRKFDLSDGLEFQETSGLGAAGTNIFACSDLVNIARFDPASNRWSNLPRPTGALNLMGNSCVLAGDNRWLAASQNGSSRPLIYDLAAGNWHNTTNRWSAACTVAADSGLWFGSGNGLHFYDPAGEIHKQWPTPASITDPLSTFRMPYSTYGAQFSPDQLDSISNQIQKAVVKFAEGRIGQRPVQPEAKTLTDPLHLDYRIPGGITAMLSDGDFLWLGAGNRLYLLHVPSASMVAYAELPDRDIIACLAQDKTSIWAGTAYGDHKLLGIPKDSFTSVPRESWISLAISSEERLRLIRAMSVRDQAMYALYAGDDARVAALLGDSDPDKAGLEDMFLLLFSYDAFGTDKPALMKAWSQHIADRFPDTPWADAAQALLAESDKNHQTIQRAKDLLAKYDTNHDGTLDDREKAAMEKDPAYLRDQQNLDAEQLDDQLAEIMKHFDSNRDGRLDRMELDRLQMQVKMFSDAPPAMLAGKKILLTPLLTKNFPAIDSLLQKYDQSGSSTLNLAGLKALANDIQKH